MQEARHPSPTHPWAHGSNYAWTAGDQRAPGWRHGTRGVWSLNISLWTGATQAATSHSSDKWVVFTTTITDPAVQSHLLQSTYVDYSQLVTQLLSSHIINNF